MEEKIKKFREIKFDNIPLKYKGSFTEQDAEEIYKEALRRVEWKKGKEWLKVCSCEVIRKEITSKIRGLAEAYFKRQEKDKKVDKLMEIIMKATKNSPN